MKRVRKEEVQVDRFVKPDGLDYCLECWSSWMLSDDRDLSASRMRLHGGAEDEREPQGYDRDVHAEQRKADMKIGEATGAMIEDMKPAWRWSIYRRCGISTQWKFPLLDFTVVIIEAEQELRKRLQKNIATATLF